MSKIQKSFLGLLFLIFEIGVCFVPRFAGFGIRISDLLIFQNFLVLAWPGWEAGESDLF